MDRSLYRIVDTAIVLICLPAYAVLMPLLALHSWVVPHVRRVRLGMEVVHWPARDQREDLLVVDVSRLADGLVGVRRRTWNVLGHRRSGTPRPPYGEGIEFWTAADFWLGRGRLWRRPPSDGTEATQPRSPRKTLLTVPALWYPRRGSPHFCSTFGSTTWPAETPMDFGALLRFAVERDASDVHVQAGMRPMLRLGGVLRPADVPPVSDELLHQFVRAIAPPRFHDGLDDQITAGLDFSYQLPGSSRFRCSAYRQLGTVGVSMRVIKSRIRTIAELQLPPVVSDIALARRGLTLVTGTTGSGKSTTLAAMIDLINQTRPAKIICIEDPVEYLHGPKQALIAQLEIGSDTPSFEKALRQSLRQDPDVILVGELRDVDTLRVALRAADTGHQVFSTVHSASAPQTVERIIAMFPPAEQKLLLTQLANNLEAIISQRLVPCADGSRRPAVEVLRGGPVVARYVLEGKSLELAEYMKHGGAGQQTFDQHLLALYQKGCVSREEALHNATNREAISVALRGIGTTAKAAPAPAPPRAASPNDDSGEDFGSDLPLAEEPRRVGR